jgi:hypothetical protein
MSNIRTGKLLEAIPAIFLMTLMNVFICSTTAGVVMIQLLANWQFCQRHSWIALGMAILTAIVVNMWIVFNHKLREYVKARSHYE